MRARLGIELGPRAVRAVRLAGWGRAPARVFEVEWDPGNPGEAVEALRERVGGARRVAVALDLALLFIKRVTLPPVDAAEKERIVRLEPERYFAARGEEIVAAARADDNLVLATREAPLTAWVTALERLAPVDVVEPGPVALARALARAGVSDAIVLHGAAPPPLRDGVGLVVVRGGRLVQVRRLFGGLDAAAAALRSDPAFPAPARLYLSPWSEEGARAVAASLPGWTAEPLPLVDGVTTPFLGALGAALAIDGRAHTPAGSLAPPDLAARIGMRRRRDLALASLACIAAFVFIVASADAWRARALDTLQHGLPSLRERAAPALALQGEIQTVAREGEAIRRAALERPDPLRVLALLSARVPAGAYLRSLRATGSAWQLDGYAPDAARLLAQLAAAPDLKDVHFLAATTRVTIGARTYESFSLAFRFAPAP